MTHYLARKPRSGHRDLLACARALPPLPSAMFMRLLAEAVRRKADRCERLILISRAAHAFHDEVTSNQWAPYGLPSETWVRQEMRRLKMADREHAEEEDYR